MPPYTWNIPLQMQFYAGLPIVIQALRPKKPGFRTKASWLCVGCMIGSMLWQAWCISALQLSWPIPELARFDAGHRTEDIALANGYIHGLYESFGTRLMAFAGGFLAYLAGSSHAAAAALQHRSRLCTGVTMAILALIAYVCFGGFVVVKSTGFPAASSLATYGMLLGVKGIAFPLSMAWLVCCTSLQPDALSRCLATALSWSCWATIADHSYNIYLLHPPIIIAMLSLIDVPAVLGPLHQLRTFLCLVFASLIFCMAMSSIQDRLIAWLERLWTSTKRPCHEADKAA